MKNYNNNELSKNKLKFLFKINFKNRDKQKKYTKHDRRILQKNNKVTSTSKLFFTYRQKQIYKYLYKYNNKNMISRHHIQNQNDRQTDRQLVS